MYSPNYSVCLKKLYSPFANEKATFQESDFDKIDVTTTIVS